MENFNAIFEQAAQTSDKRKKVLNQLIEVAKTKLIPQFMDACEGYGLKEVFFKTFKQPVQDFEVRTSYEEEEFYTFGFNVKTKQIFEADYVWGGDNFYYNSENATMYDIEEVKLTRIGIVEMVKTMMQRLEQYNKKYDKVIEQAQELIEKIEA